MESIDKYTLLYTHVYDLFLTFYANFCVLDAI